MGIKTSYTLEDKRTGIKYSIPEGSSIHEIAQITGLSIIRITELLSEQSVEVSSCCECGECIPDCKDAECSKDCPDNDCIDPCKECINGNCVDIKCFSWQTCQEGVCVDNECSSPCPTDIVINETGCQQTIIDETCYRGECVQDPTTERIININEGQPCNTKGTCIEGDCVTPSSTSQKCGNCLDQGSVGCENGSGQCCDDLICIDNVCTTLPLPTDANFVVVYDTTSFSTSQAQIFNTDYVQRYINEFQEKYPDWTGELEQYSIGDLNRIIDPSIQVLSNGQFGAFAERWVSWGSVPLNTEVKSVVLICLIDESDFDYITVSSSTNPVGYEAQPKPNYASDRANFITNIHPNYDYFRGIVYSVPAGSLTQYYRLQHLHVYAAIEGTTVSEADFIPSYSGDISIIKTSNPYAALGDGLKSYDWQEKHDFPNGNITGLTYEEWEATMNKAIGI